MPHQNRVQPDGGFLAVAARGAFYGNRGCLHGGDGQIGAARWKGRAWITCTLNLKPGREKHPRLTPGRYTDLYFHDEAVACAAGHRPCAECRRAAYRAFQAAWAAAFGARVKAVEMDLALHQARVDPATRRQRTHVAAAETLPDGTFIRWRDQPHLLWGEEARPFTATGYAEPLPRPTGPVTVLTPAPLVAVMAQGWRPLLRAEDDRPNW
jgi:hypothetical protein